jgi:7-cyano-7-deazaguanine synthase
MPRDLAIVLANGSIASAVTCALAAQKYRPVMVFCETTASPGKPGQTFDAVVQHYKPYRSHRLPMTWLSSLSRTDVKGVDADPRTGEATTNKLLDLMPMISAGLRYATHYNAAALMLGLRVGGEGQELARVAEHVQIWTEMVQMTCDRPGLEVQTPLLELEPWQVVDLGFQVSAPLQLTWSCDGLTGEPCGQCRGCRVRDVAFQRAGKIDPLSGKPDAGGTKPGTRGELAPPGDAARAPTRAVG